jgi:hypothetical protein
MRRKALARARPRDDSWRGSPVDFVRAVVACCKLCSLAISAVGGGSFNPYRTIVFIALLSHSRGPGALSAQRDTRNARPVV